MQCKARRKRILSKIKNVLHGRGDEGLGYSVEVEEEDEAIDESHCLAVLQSDSTAPLGISDELLAGCQYANQLLYEGRFEEFLQIAEHTLMSDEMSTAIWDYPLGDQGDSGDRGDRGDRGDKGGLDSPGAQGETLPERE
ncbi:hypothetical protein KIPB_009279 [Kipferlia bialata]|uniref:Uncharacterized protein n=1 Tax=Kipferlia bialata TaxID=797122 RepID=A0A9K3D2X1_9EUKA|nr:hypothetical protein KIPB_009279 [Kipferlia bialata]|eukprot:g9279.t1